MDEALVRRATSGPGNAWSRWLRWGTWRREVPEPGELALAREVGELERAYSRLSADELRERGARYRRAVRVGSPVSEISVEMLALLRELAHRELGVRASDAQIAAAGAIADGSLAQLAPGEGKSLACIFAAALASLEGRGAHLLLADPYLARRAALRGGALFEALGLSFAVLDPDTPRSERRKRYAADVLFAAADEIARDTLADACSRDDLGPVQPRLHAAVVDDLDALWLEPAGARWVARAGEHGDGPPLGALLRARIPDLYARRGGASSVARPLAELLGAELEGEVLELAAQRPSGRLDHPDVLFTHAPARDRALVESTSRAHVEGRPVLIAVANAAEAARLGERLRAASVRASELEARPGEVNAAVLERAGAPGAVTLAIRGVDRGIAISLGRGVAAQGGLCVIATSRPGLRLADESVRGWAGQRGSPGATRFFLSLDDVATFGPDAGARLSRRWRELREPGPLTEASHTRELAQLLALREREHRAGLQALAAWSRVLESQRRIAAVRRESLREEDALHAFDSAWSAHLGRTDALRRELAERGRGADAFGADASASFSEFMAAASDRRGEDALPAGRAIELELDPGLRG